MPIELKMHDAASSLGTHLSSGSTGTLQASTTEAPPRATQQLLEAPPHWLILLLLQPPPPHPTALLPAFAKAAGWCGCRLSL